MNNPLIIIADSDSMIAQGNLDDANHKKGVLIAEKLSQIGATVIYPSCIVVEAATMMQRRIDPNMAKGTLSLMIDPSIIIEPVDQSIIAGALKYFDPEATKENTIFDCCVAAVADKYKADYIFSWDKFYKKNGFRLAEEFLGV